MREGSPALKRQSLRAVPEPGHMAVQCHKIETKKKLICQPRFLLHTSHGIIFRDFYYDYLTLEKEVRVNLKPFFTY